MEPFFKYYVRGTKINWCLERDRYFSPLQPGMFSLIGPPLFGLPFLYGVCIGYKVLEGKWLFNIEGGGGQGFGGSRR